jgi:urease subunit beta
MGDDLVPGETIRAQGAVTINEGRETETLTVANTGDRPVQVGSHFHFFEANAHLAFDRAAAFGTRLDVPAGTAVRFEPGERQTVQLVAIGGERVAHGMNGLTNGALDGDPAAAIQRAREAGYRFATDVGDDEGRIESTVDQPEDGAEGEPP